MPTDNVFSPIFPKIIAFDCATVVFAPSATLLAPVTFVPAPIAIPSSVVADAPALIPSEPPSAIDPTPVAEEPANAPLAEPIAIASTAPAVGAAPTPFVESLLPITIAREDAVFEPFPKTMLSVAVATELVPMAIVLFAVVSVVFANPPTATLPVPVVIACNALMPTAMLSDAVVTAGTVV